MSAAPREALWPRLRQAGVTQGELPPAEPSSPWFVRLMLGVAGWIGATFLFGFVSVALAPMMRSTSSLLAAGALVCAAAALALRAGRPGDLLGQFAFAASLAGQGLLAAGLSKAFAGSAATTAAAIAAQQAILFFAVPGLAHRVWAAGSGACAAAFALGKLGLGAYAPGLLTAACALAWLRELDDSRRSETVRAAGYGLGVAAVLSAVLQGSWVELLWPREARALAPLHFWGGALAGAAAVLWSAAALLRREGVPLSSPDGKAAMLGALIVAATSAKAPGIAPATVLVVLGYANANRVLAGFGILALIGYLSYYYYSLQATLLEKSVLLAAAGVALLIARLALHRLGAKGRGA